MVKQITRKKSYHCDNELGNSFHTSNCIKHVLISDFHDLHNYYIMIYTDWWQRLAILLWIPCHQSGMESKDWSLLPSPGKASQPQSHFNQRTLRIHTPRRNSRLVHQEIPVLPSTFISKSTMHQLLTKVFLIYVQYMHILWWQFWSITTFIHVQ